MSLKESFEVDERTRRKLLAAAAVNDVATLEKMMAGGGDPNTANDDQQTLLHIAAAAGHAEAIRTLIAADADIHRTEKEGHSVLRFALRSQSLPCVQALLEAGVDPYSRSYCVDEGRPTSDAMICVKSFDIATALHRHSNRYFINEIVNRPVWEDDEMLASRFKFQPDIPADTLDRFGRTALMHACALGYAKYSALLLAHGADPNMTGRDGLTPLHIAVQGKNASITRQLVGASARIFTKTPDGATPLDLAQQTGNAAIIATVKEAADTFVNGATLLGNDMTLLKPLKFRLIQIT